MLRYGKCGQGVGRERRGWVTHKESRLRDKAQHHPLTLAFGAWEIERGWEGEGGERKKREREGRERARDR